jgi:O-antigen/teichoic acid export membrane protein
VKAAATARRLLLKSVMVTASVAVLLAVTAPFVIPFAYGSQFAAAVGPAQILLIGLAADGAAGVLTGFLYGVGRPGLNSWAMGAGLVVTVVLDLLLIPPLGASGAAIASSVAYISSTLALLAFFWKVNRTVVTTPTWRPAPVSGAET